MVKCRILSENYKGYLIGKRKYRMKYCKFSTYIAEGLSKFENFTRVSLRGGFG